MRLYAVAREIFHSRWGARLDADAICVNERPDAVRSSCRHNANCSRVPAADGSTPPAEVATHPPSSPTPATHRRHSVATRLDHHQSARRGELIGGYPPSTPFTSPVRWTDGQPTSRSNGYGPGRGHRPPPEGGTMHHKISVWLRLTLAIITGTTAGIARAIAERTLDLFTH